MKYHVLPGRMVTVKTSVNNKCWPGCRENPCMLLVEMEIGAVNVENSMEIHQKTKKNMADSCERMARTTTIL